MVKLNDEPNVDWLDDVKLDPTREEIEDLARFNAIKERFFDPIESQGMRNLEALLKMRDTPPNLSDDGKYMAFPVRFDGDRPRGCKL